MSSPQPIFIIGSGRSGTSALTWAVGQHPNVLVLPEAYWLTAFASFIAPLHVLGSSTTASHFARFDVQIEKFAQSVGIGVDHLVRTSYEARFPTRHQHLMKPQKGMAYFRAKDDPKARWVDGTPSSTPYVQKLAMMFPDARFIHLIRDPEAVVLSWLGISWRDPAHKQAIDLLTHIYHSQRAGYLGEAALGPERCMRVMFDDMVSQPEATLRRVCAFICEDYSDAMAEPLAEKINSTGGTSDRVREEYAEIADHQLLRSLRHWFYEAQLLNWQIDAPEAASRELDIYAAHRIQLPSA